MSDWLLDTNVLSELRRAQPEAKVVRFVASQRLERLYVSSVTFAEIRFGIERVDDLRKREALNEWLAQKLRPMFENRALPVTEDIMLTWRILVDHGRRVRHTLSQPDLIIAATALRHGLRIATRNTSDYDKTGAAVFDPWKDAPDAT